MSTDLLDLIQQERRRRGWSMRAAANAAGVSNTTWSRVEAGAVPMTPHMVAAIARAFDWPADWETNPPTSSHPPDTVAVSDFDERLRRIERLQAEILERLKEDNERTEQLQKEMMGGHGNGGGVAVSDDRRGPGDGGATDSDSGRAGSRRNR